MAFQIRDPKLERVLDEMAAAQPARTTKRSLVMAILRVAADEYRRTRDPVGWMVPPNRKAARGVSGAQER